MQQTKAIRHVDADVPTALGRIRAERASWSEPIDSVGTPDEHWLELSLLPRTRLARGCFLGAWSPHRFERIGMLFFLPARHAIHALSDCPVQSSIVCVFNPENVREWLDDAFEWTDGRLQNSLDLANPVIRRLVVSLGEEVRNPGFESQAMIELMSAQIALELSRHFRGICEDRQSGGLPPWRLRLIDECLADQTDSPSLTELATLCGLSVRQLARAFRASRGCSVGTYLAEHRLNQAKQMLRENHSMKAIAHACGFGSPSNFSVACRRATGGTPRNYRARSCAGLLEQ